LPSGGRDFHSCISRGRVRHPWCRCAHGVPRTPARRWGPMSGLMGNGARPHRAG
jgi:hypothetical protein